MDTITVITISIAVVASGVAYFFFFRARTLAAAVDDARARIGGSAPRWSWRRTDALDESLQHLERSTAQAQRQRSRLAGAVQAATDGIVITDDHGTVLVANHAAGELVGARQGEEVPDSKLRNAIEQAVLTRNAASTEMELLTPTRRILEIGAIPLDFGVESVGTVAYIRDATEQRRAEAVHRDFVSNVGRELQTPLASLSVLAESIAAELEDAKGPRRMARRLAEEAEGLRALVENILDLSQAEALASGDQPISVATLVTAVVEASQPMAAEAGVDLIVEDPPAQSVSGDLRQLRSMLSNLVQNAINHSQPAVNDQTPRVWLRTSTKTGAVVFDVQDEGTGIAAEHLERIFERFYRVDRGEGGPGGTGLGLSIARRIARNHGGDVTAMSKPGEGSIFTVTLPLWSEG